MEREWLKQTSIYWRKGAGDTFVTGSLSGGAAMLKDVVDFASFILGAVKGVKGKIACRELQSSWGRSRIVYSGSSMHRARAVSHPLWETARSSGLILGGSQNLTWGLSSPARTRSFFASWRRRLGARKGMIFSWNFSEKEKTTIELNLIQMEIAAGNFRAAQNLLMATA